MNRESCSYNAVAGCPGLPAVVYADLEIVAGIISQLGWILFPPDLFKGRIGVFVEL